MPKGTFGHSSGTPDDLSAVEYFRIQHRVIRNTRKIAMTRLTDAEVISTGDHSR